MGGLKFLNLKGWHPSNAANQKRIWIAEQKAKELETKEKEAAKEVRKSAELARYRELAASQGDADTADRLAAQSVSFLYAPPPGLDKGDKDKDGQDDAIEDDAVRDFRRKVDQRRSGHGDDPRRNLERYVGRRADETLTIKDQVERFPFLKDAPVEGAYTQSVKVNFKPVGKQLRNVRCMRCHVWGHQSGDRECELRHFNPHDAARQAREDPLAVMNQLHDSKKQQLVLRKAALPLEMQEGDAAAGEEYEILLSDEAEDADPEQEFLATLSTKEKKKLLKTLRRQKRNDSKEDRKKKSNKKHKRSKSKRDESDSDSASSESSDEEGQHSRRTRDKRREQRNGSDSRGSNHRSRSRERISSRDATAASDSKHETESRYQRHKRRRERSRSHSRSHRRQRSRSRSRSRNTRQRTT